MKKIKFIILLIIILTSLSIINNISAEIIIDTNWNFTIGNETYKVNDTTRTFNQIIIDTNYIVFNTTGFNITSTNPITIYIDYINNSIINADDNDMVLEFCADTNAGSVTFNINGFRNNQLYTVKRNGTTISTPTSNGVGQISFTNNVWSKKVFTIFQTGSGTPPGGGPGGSSVNPPTNLYAKTINWTVINLTWTKGIDSNYTHIRRKTNSPPTNINDGTLVYNNTGTTYINTGLNNGTHYYYRGWGYNNSTNTFSIITDNDNNWTAPGDIYNLRRYGNYSWSIHLQWNKYTIPAKTVIRMSQTSYPPDPDSGTLIYNGSGIEYILKPVYPNSTFYFAAWSYLDAVDMYSEYNDTLTVTTKTNNTNTTLLDDIIDNPIQSGMTPFDMYLGVYLWVFIFILAIGIAYIKTHSISVTIAVILLVFGLFGTMNGFIQTPELSLWFFLIAVLGYAGVFITIIVKRRFEK